MVSEGFIIHTLLEGRLLLASKPELKDDPFWQRWLEESQGIPSQLEKLLDTIVNSEEVDSALDAFSEKTEKTVIDLYKLCKDLPGNFMGPGSELALTLYLYNPEEGRRTGGGYIAPHAKYDKEADLLDNTHIISYSPVRPGMKRATKLSLQSTLAHELTHAYEDYCRYRNGASSMTDRVKSGQYHKVKNPEDIMDLWYYVTDSSEQNAYIAGAVDDVRTMLRAYRNLGKISQFSGIRDIGSFIGLTQMSRMYREISAWVYSYQWDRYPEYVRQGYLDKYKKLTGKSVTYSQLVRIVQSTWEKFDKKLKTKISQAVVNTLAEKPEEVKESKERLTDSIIYSAY